MTLYSPQVDSEMSHIKINKTSNKTDFKTEHEKTGLVYVGTFCSTSQCKDVNLTFVHVVFYDFILFLMTELCIKGRSVLLI